jgi:hypothetical protein
MQAEPDIQAQTRVWHAESYHRPIRHSELAFGARRPRDDEAHLCMRPYYFIHTFIFRVFLRLESPKIP